MPIVLVVDDSPVALHALAAGLGAAGLAVRRAATAADAAAADAENLACAVIDIDLPDGSGVDVADALRARRASLPVAFFTAGADRALLDRARARGPVLAKPDVAAVVAWARTQAYPPPTK
jgi:DNA-binding response OmpR family regulator